MVPTHLLKFIGPQQLFIVENTEPPANILGKDGNELNCARRLAQPRCANQVVRSRHHEIEYLEVGGLWEWRLSTIGAENNSTDGSLNVSRSIGGSRVTKHAQEFLKIASHSPFDEHILRRYFSLLDCAAGQSRANQFGVHHAKWPEFRACCPQTGLEKVSWFTPQASFVALFSEGPIGSPVSETPPGERNAITSR